MAEQMPAPTKTNLIKEKRNLELAVQGYDLLEKKREILVIELVSRIDSLELLEKEIAEKTQKAYAALQRMLLAVGRERARAISSMPIRDITLSATYVNVSGVRLPTLDVHADEPRLPYSFMNSFATCDETVIEFTELLEKLSAAAGMRSIVWWLAREVRKTQRRVNALDKMVIPRSKAVVEFIDASLDEQERESLFAVKMLKQRLSGQEQS